MKFKNYAILLLLAFVGTFIACKEAEVIPKSTAKAITKFTFSQFSPAVQATIDESTKKITAVVPPPLFEMFRRVSRSTDKEDFQSSNRK
jgi:hypothetical protein